MKNSTKKWLTVAGCVAVCAVLVVLIGGRFQTEQPKDEPLPSQSVRPGEVTVETPTPEKENEVVVTPPEITAPTQPTDHGAVSTGTEQTIQPDPIKPAYTEEQLQDPTQKPGGEKVSEPPKSVEHDKVAPPVQTPEPPSQSTGGNSIPGFDNVPNLGENQVIEGESDGDINKQVGIMGN